MQKTSRPKKTPTRGTKTAKKTIKKPVRKKPASKTIKKPAKPTKKSPHAAPKKKISAKKNGMNFFQQCVLLSAIINQKRHLNTEYLLIPLADINSATFKSLHEHLSHFTFTRNDIQNAASSLIASKEFKSLFPVRQDMTNPHFLTLEAEAPELIMHQLLMLAGPEAKKIIYLIEHPHQVEKTTLEKHAFKTGQVTHLPTELDTQTKVTPEHTHKQIINQINQQKSGRNFGQHFQFHAGRQKRGRG